MSMRIRITFDENVTQAQRFQIEQDFASSGWLIGPVLKQTESMPPRLIYQSLEGFWTNQSAPPEFNVPLWCHIEKI